MATKKKPPTKKKRGDEIITIKARRKDVEYMMYKSLMFTEMNKIIDDAYIGRKGHLLRKVRSLASERAAHFVAACSRGWTDTVVILENEVNKKWH